MTSNEFGIFVLAVIAVPLSYWVGHIDGYWKRAEEDRLAEMAAVQGEK